MRLWAWPDIWWISTCSQLQSVTGRCWCCSIPTTSEGPGRFRCSGPRCGDFPPESKQESCRPPPFQWDSSHLSESGKHCRVGGDFGCGFSGKARRHPGNGGGRDDGVTDPETTIRLLRGVEQRARVSSIFGLRVSAPVMGWAISPLFPRRRSSGTGIWPGRSWDARWGIALHGSSGLSRDALCSAVDAGVVKVNWSSESLRIRSAGGPGVLRVCGSDPRRTGAPELEIHRDGPWRPVPRIRAGTGPRSKSAFEFCVERVGPFSVGMH